MTMLIGQILGCLLVAAGIGGAVGWLLRQLSSGQTPTRVYGRHCYAAPQRTNAGEGAG